jgi:hypothetical protein
MSNGPRQVVCKGARSGVSWDAGDAFPPILLVNIHFFLLFAKEKKLQVKIVTDETIK